MKHVLLFCFKHVEGFVVRVICMVNDIEYTDSTIHSVDSLKIILRSFNELMDEDSLILYDSNSLDIKH